MGGGLGALWGAGGGHRGLSEPPAALSSRGTLVLEAALRSALMALEQALAEQQKQRGACGLCAPCLFPPCANITQRCPRESHLTPPQPYPIPYRSYPGNIPHSCQPYRLCQNAALFAKDPTETLPSDSTQADPHPLEILPKLKPYPKHCQTLSSHPKYSPHPPKKNIL